MTLSKKRICVRHLLLAVFASLLTVGCATPEVLTQPIATPRMALPATTPLPAYAEQGASGHGAGTSARQDDPMSVERSAARTGAALEAEPASPSAETLSDASPVDWGAILALSDGTLPEWARKTDAGYVTAAGVTVTRQDDFFFKSDGTWGHRVGNIFRHSDGRVTVKNGDTYVNSDGSWSRRVGNIVTRSNGGPCTIHGATLVCP